MRRRLSWDWHSLPGRVAGSGLAGAALGAVVAGIWHASWTSNLGCPPPTRGSIDGGICLPAGLWLLTIAVNCVVIAAGVWGAFTLLRLRPRGTTVPGGCAVTVLMILVSTGAFGPQLRLFKSPPTPWIAALEAGAGLAAFALATQGGRLRLAGILALALAVVAAVQVPPLVRQHELTDARMHDLTALGFPLQVPSLPGYHATIADASEGTLLVTLDQSVPYPGTTEIFFEIGPAGGTWAAGELAMCAGPGRSRPLYDACSAHGPHLWLLTNNDPLFNNAALAESAGLVMQSSTNGDATRISNATLIAAVTSLRPASAASLAGLRG